MFWSYDHLLVEIYAIYKQQDAKSKIKKMMKLSGNHGTEQENAVKFCDKKINCHDIRGSESVEYEVYCLLVHDQTVSHSKETVTFKIIWFHTPVTTKTEPQ
jgi:hypothetical protein